jgi:hypothetical protein
MVVYPSISADAPGRLIGRLMNSIPLPFTKNVKLSALILGLPLAPFGALWYAIQKVAGNRYVLTNRSIAAWSSIGQRLSGSVPLGDIADISVVERKGQAFFRAADLEILDAGGNVALTLPGVPRAEVFRQIILKARDAHTQVEAALATIGARSAR